MRQIGRLIYQLRKNQKLKIKYLSNVLEPENIDDIVNATIQLCTAESGTSLQNYQVPSLALKIGYALKKCIAIERGIQIKKGNLQRNRRLLAFEAILDSEWGKKISAGVSETINNRKSKMESMEVDDARLSGEINEREPEAGKVGDEIKVEGKFSLLSVT